MDKSFQDANGHDNRPVSDIGTEKVEGHQVESEVQSLLPPRQDGGGDGMSRKADKKRRKVHWTDSNGSKLAEVLEFQPSDASDSDDEDSDSCICTIM